MYVQPRQLRRTLGSGICYFRANRIWRVFLYYSQLRAWAAASASLARSSWLLASARALDLFCFFCALSCDWSLPPLEDAFARASAASAAFLRASPGSLPESPPPPEPRVRGGPPTFLGTGAVLGPVGGAEPRRRPARASGSDSVLPQMLPIVFFVEGEVLRKVG